VGIRVETAPRQDSPWVGPGKGQGVTLYPHLLQKLKIPKRRISGKKGTEEEGLVLLQGH
jgi:hypothetical protein